MSSTLFGKPCQPIDWAEFARTLDWAPVRRERRLEDWMLMAATADWLKALPVGARPVSLHRRFPRIANELHRLWNQKQELSQYFEGLLEDARGTRQGFPPLIREELLALQAYALCMPFRASRPGSPGPVLEAA